MTPADVSRLLSRTSIRATDEVEIQGAIERALVAAGLEVLREVDVEAALRRRAARRRRAHPEDTMNGNDNLPPGLTGNEDHIQGGDPRFDAEAERFALALGDQLDALYDDHQEEIIRLGTEHILLRLDEEARGPDVLDLSDLDTTRIREEIDAWRADPVRCAAILVLDEVFEEPKPALRLTAAAVERIRHALCFIDGAICGLHDDEKGARPVSDALGLHMLDLFATFGMAPPVATTWGTTPPALDDDVAF